MINYSGWEIHKINQYAHQILLACTKYLAGCLDQFRKDEIDGNTCFEAQKQILIDEINNHVFLEFAIENIGEMIGYIVDGNLNITILKDITGEIRFGVSKI